MILIEILIWIILPIINFLFWYQVGQDISIIPYPYDHADRCPPPRVIYSQEIPSHGHMLIRDHDIKFNSVESSKFQKHREERIVKLNYPHNTTIINYYPSVSCDILANNLVLDSASTCFGIVMDKTPPIESSHLLLRYEKEALPSLHFSGFFSRPGNLKGRTRFANKIQPLLNSLKEVEREMDELLLERNIRRGDDIVVMVVNEGEMDLFMNFACSCHLHNISLSNILVFSASGEIIPLITSTGALGYYHSEFATASKAHSVAYLDGVFVDMMWYKAFSVWLLLHLERNVLFQDVDIIWLKDPFPYFHKYLNVLRSTSPNDPLPDAFLSDDGQRASPRFSPFYANSGFYYFISNPRTIHVTWLIMLSFDVMQSGGSHQNVYTQRLVEVFDQYGLITQSLTQKDFTNGATYHHTPSFIKRMQQKQVIPYMFHMCWTANKLQKLQYFNASHMWYIREGLSYQNFTGEGKFNQYASRQSQKGKIEKMKKGDMSIWDEIWSKLENQICFAMENSP